MNLKNKLTTSFFATVLAIGFAGSASAGGMLRAPVPDWTGGAVTCEVIHYVLENEMGYKVKRITMPAWWRALLFLQIRLCTQEHLL